MGGRAKVRDIKTSEWKPTHQAQDYPEGLVAMIDSINEDFRKIKYYKPFDLYVKQAEFWLDENVRITQFSDKTHQQEFIAERKERCQQNSLYATNWQGWLKEGDVAEGKLKFKASKAQQILSFLDDCGYSMIIVKGRQIGFTSQMGLIAGNDLNVRKNFFTKFITHDVQKGEEIFDDKIRYPFTEIESYFQSNVVNSSSRELKTGVKDGKLVVGTNCKLYVGTPSQYAINGGSPQKVLLDEIGMFEGSMYLKMLDQARPAMYFHDTKTNKLVLKRQIIGWGTGGDMDKGGAELEVEFKAAMAAWKERDFSYGFIPLFFSCWARLGFTQQIYDDNKRYYYRKNKAEQRIVFHQSFPLTLDDVFLRNAETLIDMTLIQQRVLKILQLPEQDQPQYGYFRAIYDTSIDYPETFKVPHPIIGAEWVPTSGILDPQTTGVMWGRPELWVNRYFQGIDPISSETGHSRFSSTIWDKEMCTAAHIVFYREEDYQMCYIQALLQRIYYSPELGKNMVKFLLENNIGDDCFNTFKLLGFERNYIAQAILPVGLKTKTGGKYWGVRKSAATSGRLVDELHEVINTYSDNINIMWIWIQLKTFVRKDVNSQTYRETKYAPQNKHSDYDDALDSLTFAYIASKCNRTTPKPMHEAANQASAPRLKRVYKNGPGSELVLALVKNGRIVGRPKMKK